MTPEAQAAALARLAADTKTACATSADIAKAANARAAAKAAHAAQAAKAAKAAKAKAEVAQAAKAAKVAKVAKTSKAAKAAKAAVNPATKGFSFHAKAAFLTHPVYFSVAGGVILGIVTYHLINKYWLNKDECC